MLERYYFFKFIIKVVFVVSKKEPNEHDYIFENELSNLKVIKNIMPEEIIKRLQAKTQIMIEQIRTKLSLDYDCKTNKMMDGHKNQMNMMRFQYENEIKRVESNIEDLNDLHQKNIDAIKTCLDSEKREKVVILSYLSNLKKENNLLQERFDQECYRHIKDTDKFQKNGIRSFDQSFLNNNAGIDFTDIEQLERQQDAKKMEKQISELNKDLLIERTKTIADSILINGLKEDYEELKSALKSKDLRDKIIISELKSFNQDLVDQVSFLKKKLEQKISSELSVENKNNLVMKSFNNETDAKLRELHDENRLLKNQILSLKCEIDSVDVLNTKISNLEAKLRGVKVSFDDFNNRIYKGVKELNDKRLIHFNNMKRELVREITGKRKIGEVLNENDPPKRVTISLSSRKSANPK